jgi:hypothetical protein
MDDSNLAYDNLGSGSVSCATPAQLPPQTKTNVSSPVATGKLDKAICNIFAKLSNSPVQPTPAQPTPAQPTPVQPGPAPVQQQKADAADSTAGDESSTTPLTKQPSKEPLNVDATGASSAAVAPGKTRVRKHRSIKFTPYTAYEPETMRLVNEPPSEWTSRNPLFSTQSTHRAEADLGRCRDKCREDVQSSSSSDAAPCPFVSGKEHLTGNDVHTTVDVTVAPFKMLKEALPVAPAAMPKASPQTSLPVVPGAVTKASPQTSLPVKRATRSSSNPPPPATNTPTGPPASTNRVSSSDDCPTEPDTVISTRPGRKRATERCSVSAQSTSSSSMTQYRSPPKNTKITKQSSKQPTTGTAYIHKPVEMSSTADESSANSSELTSCRSKQRPVR